MATSHLDSKVLDRILRESKRLQKRVKELERIIDMQICVACGGLLLLSDSPPHCEDCHPDEEQEITWQRKVRKWDEELEKELQKLRALPQAPGV